MMITILQKMSMTKDETLQLAEKLARKSKLTAKDVEDFSKKITSSATKRFLNVYRD